MKILLVVEKPSIEKVIKKVIEKYKKNFLDEYYFDYIKPVFHIDDDVLLFRKKDDNIYQMGKKFNFNYLQLNSIDIPKDTFIESSDYIFSYKNDYLLKEVDKIICFCDPDNCGKLAFAKYLEIHNLKYEDVYYAPFLDLTEKAIYKTLLSSFENFQKVFENLKNELINTSFSCEYPRKKNVITLRLESNMNRVEFAKYFNIPYRTIENWEHNISSCPTYLYELMEYKLEKENKFFLD